MKELGPPLTKMKHGEAHLLQKAGALSKGPREMLLGGAVLRFAVNN